jgi:phage-related minor tail protein
MAKVYIELEAKDKVTPVARKMDKNTEQAFNKMKANAKASTASMGSSIDKLKKHWVAFSAAAVAGVLVLRKAVTAVMARVEEWINLSKVQELAEISLAAALKAAGEYTDILNKEYQEFASWIQRVTKYGDEQVLGLMALIKNLGVSTDKVREATKMAIGLATATGRDVSSMAQYVALAIKGEYTMLRRYIPALRTTTDATEQMRIVTDFAARGFKVAQEMTASFSIALIQLANLWADLKEKLGDFATRNKVIMEQLHRAKDYLIDLNDELQNWITNNQELINQKTHEVIQNITIAVKALVLSLKTLNKLKNIFRDIFLHMSLGINQLALLAQIINKLKPAKIEGQGVIRMKIEKPEKPELPLLEDATPKMAYDLGLINAELRVFQLQSEAAWAAYKKGIKEAIPKQDEFMAGIYGERTAIMLLEQEIEKGLAQSFKSIGEQGKTTFDDLKNAVTGWGSTFSAQLNDMLWAADTTFRDILESFGRMITQMIIQKQVVEPMLGSKWFKNWGSAGTSAGASASAHGNVFNKGQVVPYERGGIITKPTVFPMATGAGLMGEKGPEAVMPLTRTKSGDLGVKAEGSSPNIQINMINQSGQPLQATKQGSRQESGKFIIDVVVKELQRGKTLRNTIRSTI